MRSGGAKHPLYVSGFFGTLDLRTDEGQQLSMGNWEKATDCVWSWVEADTIDLRRPKWFRNGYSGTPIE
jgi:hypothetical protein